MTPTCRHRLGRRGITLVELLVVVSIMMMLALVALPAMRPAMESRKMREAARAINVFISSVRTRAIETRRPCGVLIQRMTLTRDIPNPPPGSPSKEIVQYTHHSQSGVMLQQVEIPPPYTGEYVDTYLRLQDWSWNATASNYYWNVGAGGTGPVVLKAKVYLNSFGPGLIRYGDLIQLNGQGPWFAILEDLRDSQAAPNGCGRDLDFEVDAQGFISFTGTDSNSDGWIDDRFLTLVSAASRGVTTPWIKVDPPNAIPGLVPLASWSPNGVRFTIYRQPFIDVVNKQRFALRSAVKPLELPTGVVIDLRWSGGNDTITATGDDWFSAVDHDLTMADVQDSSPVIIIFGPGGDVQGIVSSRAGSTRVTQPIHLLLGSAERMILDAAGASAADDHLANWQDLENFWITLQPQSGLVSVSPVYAQSNHVANGINRPETLQESREMARRAQFNAGGR